MPEEKILIVEDERIVAEEVRHILSSMGYVITGVVSTGADAVRLAGETTPDLILMDIKLKGDMDGIEAAGIVLERFSIPVIYLTAYSDEATIQRAKLTRPLGYIIKPLDRIQVHSVIEVALYRYRREKVLIESEKWLSRTLKTIENGIAVVNGAGLVQYMNPAAAMLMGVAATQTSGRNIDELATATDIHDRQRIPAFFGRIIAGRPAAPVKGSVILASGDDYEIPVSYVISPAREESGMEPGYIIVLHDISKRLKIENVLQATETKCRSFADAAGEGVMSVDQEHRILFVNKAMADMLAYSKDHMIGQPLSRFVNTDSAMDLQLRLSDASDNAVIRCDTEMKKSDGSKIWAVMTINRMKDKNGNYSGAVAMVSDVTGRKVIESKLIEARTNTELYLGLIEKEIGKMNQIVMGYLDTTDELLD